MSEQTTDPIEKVARALAGKLWGLDKENAEDDQRWWMAQAKTAYLAVLDDLANPTDAMIRKARASTAIWLGDIGQGEQAQIEKFRRRLKAAVEAKRAEIAGVGVENV